MKNIAQWLRQPGGVYNPAGSRVKRRADEQQWRVRALYCVIENLALSALIYAVWFALSPRQEHFLTMNLHPLLIMVAMSALRYGNYLGLVSATFASIVFLYANYVLGRDLVLFFTSWEHYKFLLMFFLTAVVLGTVRDYGDQRVAELETQLSDVQDERNALLEAQQKANIINRELKRQIIGTEDSILSLYNLSLALESLRPETLYSEVASVLARFLRAQAVSIYTVEANGEFLRLKVDLGHDTLPPKSLRASEHQYLTTVLKEQKAYRVSIESAPSDPLFSAPILRDDKVIAVINVDQAIFHAVTEYSFQLFRLVVEWTARSLERALDVDEARTAVHYLPNSRFLRMPYFEERLAEERQRFVKFGLPYKLLALDCEHSALPALEQSLNQCLRLSDVRGYDESKQRVLVLLPLTDAGNLANVQARLANCLGAVRMCELDAA